MGLIYKMKEALQNGVVDIADFIARKDPHTLKPLLESDGYCGSGAYWSILHTAVMHQSWPAFKQLVEAGASLWATTRYDMAVVHYTILYGTTDMVRVVLAHLPSTDITVDKLLRDFCLRGDNLVRASIGYAGDEYTPSWADGPEDENEDENKDEEKPPEYVKWALALPRTRAANMDLILATLADSLTSNDLMEMLHTPLEMWECDDDDPIPEVVEVITNWHRWSPTRRVWVKAAVFTAPRPLQTFPRPDLPVSPSASTPAAAATSEPTCPPSPSV